MSAPAQFPNRLRELRAAKGYTLESLADAVGMTKSQIQRLETGETGFDIDTMKRIGKELHVRPSEFLIDDDVEFRAGPGEKAIRNAIKDFAEDDAELLMRAAADIAHIVKRLAPKRTNVALAGDSVQTSQLADLWNDMDARNRDRALDFLKAAYAVAANAPTLMAAE